MNSIILRVDDVNTGTTPADLEGVYSAWWAAGWPVCFSVIPRAAYRFSIEGISPVTPVELAANKELSAFLREKASVGLVDIALHGYEHHFGELSTEDARQRLIDGLAVLRSALPELNVRVLVPPHDYLTMDGLKAAHTLGLTVCSTWAATHGGGRRAHWWGRLRRWAGCPFGPLWAGRLPTDSQLLDFADESPSTKTESRLWRAWRTGIVPVLTQHYWLIQGERFRRWQAWISHLKQIPSIQVKTYADLLHHHHHV